MGPKIRAALTEEITLIPFNHGEVAEPWTYWDAGPIDSQAIPTHGRLWLSLLGVSLPRDVSLLLLAMIWVPRRGAMGPAAALAVAWGISVFSTAVLAARVSRAVREKTSS